MPTAGVCPLLHSLGTLRAGSRTRTGTGENPPGDFKSPVSAIPPPRRNAVRCLLPRSRSASEAAAGFEPANKGFADLRLSHLATPPGPPRKIHADLTLAIWSERRDSNPRQPRWQRGALPTELLSQHCQRRLYTFFIKQHKIKRSSSLFKRFFLRFSLFLCTFHGILHGSRIGTFAKIVILTSGILTGFPEKRKKESKRHNHDKQNHLFYINSPIQSLYYPDIYSGG